nr:DNA-binding response regulator [uncultured Flavobacterium sp.]
MRKILIIEDELILSTDLKELIQGMKYDTAVANSYDEAVAIATLFLPDLILCDINLNDSRNGIDLIKHLQTIGLKFEVIYLTAYSSEDVISDAENTTPFNYLTKPYNDAQIEVAVRLVFNFIKQQTKVGSLLDKITTMELKILELIASQKTSKEIAQLLHISDKTVRNHRYNIVKKMGIPIANNSLSKWAISNFKSIT